MKKIIKNVGLLVCAGGIVGLSGLLLTHRTPIEVSVPVLTSEEVAEMKKEAAQTARAAKRKQKLDRIYACKTDEDCVIVDKDPCGCGAGPKGVTAININYITDFGEFNSQSFGAITCPEVVSREKECSLSARAVCQARRCKITY